jgi:uncharacterized protein YdhG (YjbR/CyaY superfamily)
MKIYKDINEYIKSTPTNSISKLKEMHATIKKLVPKGKETISYGMPTIKLNGKNFVHYASMKGHLGFYPAPSGIKAYETDLKKQGISYSKGCIRFSYDKPLPVPLITKIIKFRLKEEK